MLKVRINLINLKKRKERKVKMLFLSIKIVI